MERVSARGGWVVLLLAVFCGFGGGIVGEAGSSYGVIAVVVVGVAAAGFAAWRGLLGLGGSAERKVGVGGGVVAMLGLLVWLGQQLGGGSAAGLLGLGPEDEGTARAYGVVALGGMAGAGLGWAAGWFATRGLPERFVRGMRGSDLVAGVGWSALCIPIVMTAGTIAQQVARLIERRDIDGLAHEALQMLVHGDDVLGGWWWVVVAYVVVAAPVIEEVIFRGFVQRGVIDALGGRRWSGIAVTSGLFAVIHVGAVDARAMVPLFALSVLLGIMRERTGRIWAGVVVHGAFNAANILLAMLG